jgi:Na+/glutamate symporter
VLSFPTFVLVCLGKIVGQNSVSYLEGDQDLDCISHVLWRRGQPIEHSVLDRPRVIPVCTNNNNNDDNDNDDNDDDDNDNDNDDNEMIKTMIIMIMIMICIRHVSHIHTNMHVHACTIIGVSIHEFEIRNA